MNNYGVLIDDKKGIKKHELDVIEALNKNILKSSRDTSIFNNYYLGYSIPQIAKEFDLLRFGENDIINIEMKTESTIDKILKQQEKNRYYLNFLGKKNHIYTYVLNENKLYKLVTDNNHNTIKEVDFTELCNKLSCQQIANITNINSLFNPSDYLVSPFNSTDKFINDSYFLTVQQDQICNKIQIQLADSSTRFIALTGGAGTGKTLLTYHIAKKAMNEGMKVLILHCAQLNNGHVKLIEECNWNIYMTKYSSGDKDSAHSVIGQEFDKVAIVIDDSFTYNSLGELTANNKCYSQSQMLYQIITRTRKKLCVIVADNEEMLNRCIDILSR